MAKHATSTTMPAVQRRARRQTVHQQRQHLEAALERLLDAAHAVLADLNALDGDADFEPSLGSVEPRPWLSQRGWAEGGSDDREGACEGEGDPGADDREPDHEGDYTVVYMMQHYPEREAL